MSVSLNNIIDINVQTSGNVSTSVDFGVGLIIGNSKKLTAEKRVVVYNKETWQTQMTTDGFSTSDPEYKAANAYFSQSPSPDKVCIGVKLSTDSTDMDALNACRQFNNDWFAFCFCYEIEDTEKPSIAEAVEAFSSPAVYIYQTNDENCLTTGKENVLKSMNKASYEHAVGFYSTQDYFSAAVLGLYSGLNSTDANSAYTITFKTVVGFVAESVTDSQYDAILSYSGNVYANFANRYSFIYPGISANGLYMDELYFIELAKYLIQNSTIDGLVSQLKVPQTESGMNQIITFINQACNKLLSIGFIATGIWNGSQILDLYTGMAVTNGYLVQAESINSQSIADRQARVTPPIYVALKSSGAIQSVVIRVFINR